MPVVPKWDPDAEAWRWRVTCDYCLDPVYNTGPLGLGTETAALAATSSGAVPFCSPACRERWARLNGERVKAVADDVDREELESLLRDGANGRIEWPE